MAYLSHMEVTDMLGRTNAIQGLPGRGSWIHREHGDVVAALQQQCDYVIPRIDGSGRPPSRSELAAEWAKELDLKGSEPGRSEAIELELENYELMTVPVRGWVRATIQPRMDPFFLLSHKHLPNRPALRLQVVEGELVLHVSGARHEQLADLSLRTWDGDDLPGWVRPTGELCSRAVVARAGLLLGDTGERHVELLRWRIPEEVARIEARLLNPGAQGERGFALIGDAVEWKR